MDVDECFGTVLKGQLALNCVLENYNAATTGNTVSKAHSDCLTAVEENAQRSDRIEMKLKLEHLNKCVCVLLKKSNVNQEEVEKRHAELSKESDDDDSFK